MIVVFAAAMDQDARMLVKRWGAAACLMTPEELSLPGWRHNPSGPLADDFLPLPRGERLSAADITGVLARLGAVTDGDLPWIAEEDRRYVGCEMTAFLRSFVDRLPVPMCNRPRPMSLMGPGWSTEHWRIVAARAGFVLGTGPGRLVHCVGGSILGQASCSGAIQRLAERSGCDLLSVRLDADDRFIDVEPWPPLDVLDEALFAWLGDAIRITPQMEEVA